MNAHAKQFADNLWARLPFASARQKEPEPINAVPREMTGFFSSLTDEQKRAAFSYRGEEAHGDPSFLIRK